MDKETNEGATPLFISAELGKTEIVKFLVTEGKAEVDKTDNDGFTPLYTSVEKGFTEIAALLFRGGANPNQAAGNGWTPLRLAKGYKHQAIVALLEQ